MNLRVLGSGAYGCHLASVLLAAGHDVEVHETADRVFSGASGNMPARLHQGPHYPRSQLTRDACRKHGAEFMAKYGEFTRNVPVNIYAVAEYDSLTDFGTYTQVLRSEIEFLTLYDPKEWGLAHVEGAILTGERHVLVDQLAAHFKDILGGRIIYGKSAGIVDSPGYDLTIDATGCSRDAVGVDRYEACLTVLLEGPTDKAITICDGPFSSLYPWDEERGLSSLTSAKWTPMKSCATWGEAREFLDEHRDAIRVFAHQMYEQMALFYPRLRDEYRAVDYRTAIRPMPRSAAAARLVDVVRVGKRSVRVRGGKLDAIFEAERVIMGMLGEFGG